MRRQIAYNMDCMDLMKMLPDKEFDLAIVDPPYGGGEMQELADVLSGTKNSLSSRRRSRFGGRFDNYKIECERTGGTWATKYGQKVRHWDIAPPQEYFDELFRVSKNQIIWGGNYFSLPGTRCFLVWRKLTISENFSMAMAEYAWTSFNQNAKVFEHAPQGTASEKRIHPTQKPVALYSWILKNFAKKGDRILDTHLGSGSSRIAAYEMGFDFVGCELDEDYFLLQEERFKKWTSQQNLFDMDGGEVTDWFL